MTYIVIKGKVCKIYLSDYCISSGYYRFKGMGIIRRRILLFLKYSHPLVFFHSLYTCVQDVLTTPVDSD